MTDTSIASNNVISNTNTEIKATGNVIKAGVAALGMILSSNQMPAYSGDMTNNIPLLRYSLLPYNGSFPAHGTYPGVYSNISRRNYAERYSIIAESEWFNKAYKNKSLGEIVGIDV